MDLRNFILLVKQQQRLFIYEQKFGHFRPVGRRNNCVFECVNVSEMLLKT